jgi:membrane protein implicated in regulation of membrane protease activity
MMKRWKIPRRVLLRYLAFQAPSWVLWSVVLHVIRDFMGFPTWIVWGLISIWIAKDFLMLPFVWRSYEIQPEQRHPLTGAEGVVEKPLAPMGYIRVRGELWRAELAEEKGSAEKGEKVQVERAEGLTLIVRLLKT